MLITLAATSPIWLSLFFVQLTGKSWRIGESAGASDVPPEPKVKRKPTEEPHS